MWEKRPPLRKTRRALKDHRQLILQSVYIDLLRGEKTAEMFVGDMEDSAQEMFGAHVAVVVGVRQIDGAFDHAPGRVGECRRSLRTRIRSLFEFLAVGSHEGVHGGTFDFMSMQNFGGDRTLFGGQRPQEMLRKNAVLSFRNGKT